MSQRARWFWISVLLSYYSAILCSLPGSLPRDVGRALWCAAIAIQVALVVTYLRRSRTPPEPVPT